MLQLAIILPLIKNLIIHIIIYPNIKKVKKNQPCNMDKGILLLVHCELFLL